MPVLNSHLLPSPTVPGGGPTHHSARHLHSPILLLVPTATGVPTAAGFRGPGFAYYSLHHHPPTYYLAPACSTMHYARHGLPLALVL